MKMLAQLVLDNSDMNMENEIESVIFHADRLRRNYELKKRLKKEDYDLLFEALTILERAYN